MATRSIMWFRRDLRLTDNPALTAAAAGGDVVPVFVFDPRFGNAGLARRTFMEGCLRVLGKSMDDALVLRHGDPVEVIASLAREVDADGVHISADFGPYGTSRDEAVACALEADGRTLVTTGSPYAVEPGRVTKADGEPYSVFTPFSRSWVAEGWGDPAPAPKVAWHHDSRLANDGYPELSDTEADLPEPGEEAAMKAFEAFLVGPSQRYDAQRNDPGLDATSHLSPYLRWGAIHPRQLLARLGASKAHQVFRGELCWREFYADVLHHRPESAWQNLQPRMDAMVVDSDADGRKSFAVWAAGQTGYPIVDAGIRQLLATGWMHNRVRMITASFLVKDLHLPWQWGAKFFMDHLVDGDLASNNHGWQWTAGTGTDAAPYFRIFNPVTQGKRFDADGRYVRRWIPELHGVGDADIQAPWEWKQGPPLGYPSPIVDHARERDESLRRYALVTGVATPAD